MYRPETAGFRTFDILFTVVDEYGVRRRKSIFFAEDTEYFGMRFYQKRRSYRLVSFIYPFSLSPIFRSGFSLLIRAFRI